MEGRFYHKSSEVRAMRFTSNNERGDVNMNAVCIMANQDRPPDADHHCWHNGTEILVTRPDRDNFKRAQIGDWIVVNANGEIDVWSDKDFEAKFSQLPIYAEEA